MKLFPFLFAAALLGGLARPVLAQTARIAQLSHSGSVAALDAAADNMGLPDNTYKDLEIVLLSDTTVVVRGWQRWNLPNAKWQRVKNIIQFRTFAKDTLKEGPYSSTKTPDGTFIMTLSDIKRNYPQAKLVGFDRKAKKPKSRKSATQLLHLPNTLPQHSTVALAVALILTLSGAGWLLGERRAALVATC